MAVKTILFLCFFVSQVYSGCSGFNVVGYKGMYSQTKGGTDYCTVECDDGFHAAELDKKFNKSTTFRTIYHRNAETQYQWKPMFYDTFADLNCQKGCTKFNMNRDPYFLKATYVSIISVDPILYYRAVVKCMDGYFSSNELPSDENDIKITMDCTRNSSSDPDTWAWSKGVNYKLNCIAGCQRTGTTMPAHFDGFGAKTTCTHLGSPLHSETDLVSNCDSSCDELNGYYPMMEKFSLDTCGSNGNFVVENLYFICEQGCKLKDAVKQEFLERNYELACKSPFSEDWYGKCGVKCKEGTVVKERGRMGKSDMVICRRGKFSFKSIQMSCEKKCTSFPDSCTSPKKCIGENEFGERFCSETSFKRYPEETD